MPIETKTNSVPEKTSVSVRGDVHRRASIAASLEGKNLLDFVCEALDARSNKILKRHAVKLPADAAQAA